MATLRHSDLQGVLGFLHQAGAETGPDPFPAPVLDLLRTLVPSEAVSWHEWTLDGGRSRYAVASVDPARTATVWEAYTEFRHQDPLPGGGPWPSRPPALVGRTLKMSDLLSDRRFRRLDLYNYVCKPLGIQHVMKLFLPLRGGLARSLVFDRGGRDFSERDRLVIRRVNAPEPTLVLTEEPVKKPMTGILTPREQEILALVADGKSNAEIAAYLWIALGTVRAHLEHIYAKLGVRSRTAALARARRLNDDESD